MQGKALWERQTGHGREVKLLGPWHRLLFVQLPARTSLCLNLTSIFVLRVQFAAGIQASKET